MTYGKKRKNPINIGFFYATIFKESTMMKKNAYKNSLKKRKIVAFFYINDTYIFLLFK